MTTNGGRPAIKQNAADIILALPPGRFPIVERLLTRLLDGMPIEDAKEMFWQEAAAEGLLNIRTQPLNGQRSAP